MVTAIENNVDHLKGYRGLGGDRSGLSVDKDIYLITDLPVQPYHIDASLVGKPLKRTRTLSAVSGYTEVGVIHFNPSNYEIYQNEVDEIVSLLHEGVIL